ncbi:MAG: mechanosensitive ion channel domain-containing protein [Pseudoxanthomonas sp.]
MIARLLLLVSLAAVGTSAHSQDPLESRAAALRATLSASPDYTSEDRSQFLRRQLLASLERRRDMQRARADMLQLGGRTQDTGLPQGVLALDDLRHELQQLDASLAGGERRLAILRQERDATAALLAERVAQLRTLRDAGKRDGSEFEHARLEAELAESATAELDLMLGVIALQQQMARRQRSALVERLAKATQRGTVQVSASDAQTIDRRLRGRAQELRERMAAAAVTRERDSAQLQRETAAGASPARIELLKERLANSDVDIEVNRELLSNQAVEQIVWQVALRYYREGDMAAVIEARERGPELRDRLLRRREYLAASSEQVLQRIGALDAELARGVAAADLAGKRALRGVLEQRLLQLQTVVLDQRRIADLIERLRGDFDQRIGRTDWSERSRLALASAKAWLARGWNFELFTVSQSVQVDGRKTTVPRGVTVGKLVKAPLLLIVGLWLSFQVTALAERWLRRRRGMDEGRARLLRRWALAVLICACVLASLALAGIPLAAFAFIGGAVAIGIGFGMQTLFKNLISGVMVLIERPFRLGDVIEVEGFRGTVVDIDLRASVLRDSDGAETLIPNSTLVEQNVKNVTFRSRTTRQTLGVVVDPASEARAVIDAMRAAAGRHGLLLESPEPLVFLEDFVDGGLRFVLHYWIELVPGTDRRRIASDLRLMMMGAFEEAQVRLLHPASSKPG